MAAIDLRAMANSGTACTVTLATTWQEFQMPGWANRVTVVCGSATYGATSQMGYLGDIETPADGGAVGTHKIEIAASTPTEITIAGASRSEASASFFLAAVGGTPSATLVLEV